MYITSVTLDGFKSYANRVEIKGFDRLFNAITGLNGSGKSNILDAICFVLGLQNVSLARATSLKDLIYKSGNAGVKKASVSITFDNRDKEKSPTNFSHFDEIVITREININSRSKYYVNGSTATQSDVVNMFHSVQLNISNPHFLIAQGRITKVLNMKPHEILSMVEEATGVALYEARKKHTQGQIEKKDSALRSIDSLIHETIEPKLQQLKKEQAALMEYQKICATIETFNKQHTAWSYLQNEERCKRTSAEIQASKDKISALNTEVEEISDQITELENHKKQLIKRVDQECGGRIKKLEDELRDEKMTETKKVSELNAIKDTLKEHLKSKKALEKSINDEKKVLKSKEAEYAKLQDTFSQLKEKNEADQRALKQAEEDFEAIQAGLFRAGDGQAATSLSEQLRNAENESASADTDIIKAKSRIKQLKGDLREREQECRRKSMGNYEQDMQNVQEMEQEVEALGSRLNSLDFNAENFELLSEEKLQLLKKCDHLRDSIYNRESQLGITFDYRDPIPGFDRRRVLGPVCTLFSIKNSEHAVALERAAGGRLYNIVVDTEETGKLLLQKGSLRRRVNFIPLNKIQGREADARALKNAQNLVGKENVSSAIDLIKFDKRVAAAMKFVFGDTLICRDMGDAKRVAYASNVNKRAISYDGDDFSPSGTLYGGAAAKGGNLLKEVIEVIRKKDELEDASARIEELNSELRSLEAKSVEYQKLKEVYDLKAKETEYVRQRMMETNQRHKLQQEMERLSKEIEELGNECTRLEDVKKKAVARAKEIQDKLKNSKAAREKEKKEADQMLSAAKKNAEKSMKEFNARNQVIEALKLELQELKTNIETYHLQMSEIDESIAETEAQIAEAQSIVNEAKSRVVDVEARLEGEKRAQTARNVEINKLSKKKEALEKSINEKQIQAKELELGLQNLEKVRKEAGERVNHMLKKHPWINEEKHLFGSKEAGYGFNEANFNSEQAENYRKSLEKKKADLKKHVNMRASVMLSDKEKTAEDLRKKRGIIEADKKKLINYMKEVDAKKRDSLTQAWRKINDDFHSIFSTLLPNSSAKLDIPAGKTIMDGLEVKVAFGEVWKESLTELSGGQRSLVALSLILALLKFNPAPIYILDEVDAALDQNHTQNTGLMIKKHFQNSQFIIVSLKEDMFKNANVLFKTRFVDGSSTVTRFSKT